MTAGFALDASVWANTGHAAGSDEIQASHVLVGSRSLSLRSRIASSGGCDAHGVSTVGDPNEQR